MDVRFGNLAIGASFEFKGTHYIKAGPLSATAERGGAERMMVRSAVVTVNAEASTSSAPNERQRLIPADPVRLGIERMYEEARGMLASNQAAPAQLAAWARLKNEVLQGLGIDA